MADDLKVRLGFVGYLNDSGDWGRRNPDGPEAVAALDERDELLREASDNLEYAAQMLDEAGWDAGSGFCQRQCNKFRNLLNPTPAKE